MRLAVCAALALVSAPLAVAQQSALDPKKSADQLQRYLNALTGCDVATLRDVIDTDVSFFGVCGAFAQSKPISIAAMDQACRAGTMLDFKQAILRHEDIGDMSLSALELHGSTKTGVEVVGGNLSMTVVMRRGADGVWRVLHAQTATGF